eukprot:SAG22_NODE_843_length_6889_cov_61.521649_2_plen_206_part_00
MLRAVPRRLLGVSLALWCTYATLYTISDIDSSGYRMPWLPAATAVNKTEAVATPAVVERNNDLRKELEQCVKHVRNYIAQLSEKEEAEGASACSCRRSSDPPLPACPGDPSVTQPLSPPLPPPPPPPPLAPLAPNERNVLGQSPHSVRVTEGSANGQQVARGDLHGVRVVEPGTDSHGIGGSPWKTLPGAGQQSSEEAGTWGGGD